MFEVDKTYIGVSIYFKLLELDTEQNLQNPQGKRTWTINEGTAPVVPLGVGGSEGSAIP